MTGKIPDFTEDLVSFMVQMMLTISRFPKAPFAMVPLSKKDERLYGADVKIESIAPLYLQFKRSHAFSGSSSAKVISDRRTLELEVSPRVLYFELRKKAKTHVEFQHNLLFDLRHELKKRGTGDAIYVAPLFLERTSYLLATHLNSLLNWRPWNYFYKAPFSSSDLSLISSDGEIKFYNCSVLREHVSIPPHKKVSTYKHKYSYLESGKEICFHSPTIIDSTKNFGQFLYDFMNFNEGEPLRKMIDFEESISLLNNLNLIAFKDKQLINKELTILQQWQSFGELLKDEYQIEQYALIKYKNNNH